LIGFLWADEKENPASVRWLMTKKHRNGPAWQGIELAWRGEIMRFDSCADETAGRSMALHQNGNGQ
jgi:hypothetical protein